MSDTLMVLRSLGLFVVAGVCEIGGGWLMWKWLRDDRAAWWGLLGAVVILYGLIPTLQASHFGRVGQYHPRHRGPETEGRQLRPGTRPAAGEHPGGPGPGEGLQPEPGAGRRPPGRGRNRDRRDDQRSGDLGGPAGTEGRERRTMNKRDGDDLDLILSEIGDSLDRLRKLIQKADEIVAPSPLADVMTGEEINGLATIAGSMRRIGDDIGIRIEGIDRIIGRALSDIDQARLTEGNES